MTLLDIYGQSEAAPAFSLTRPLAPPHPQVPAEPLADSIPPEAVWELPIGSALAIAAAAWVVQALLMHYALGTGGWAIVWPLNGVVAGLMLGKSRRDWLLILPFVMLATTLHAGSVTGHWFTAGVDSAINAIEVFLVLNLLPPFESLQQWLRTPRLTARSAVATFVTAPLASGILAAAFYSLAWHSSPWNVFRQWAAAGALGLAATIPLILALRTPDSWSLRQPIPLLRSALLLAAIAALAIAVFTHPQLSLEFILFPALGAVLFLSSFTVSMLAIACICGIAVHSMLHRYGSSLLSAHAREVSFLQLFLGLIVLAGFATAVLLAERRIFHARFRSSERQYRLLAESSRDVIVLTDLDGKCRFVSPASIDVLGYDPEGLQGLPFHHGMHEEDSAQCMSLLHEIRLGLAKEGMLTCRSTTPDGRSIWIEGCLRATTDEAGDVHGAILTLRDITETRRLQQQLREACTQLEHQAAFDALTNVANRRRFDDIYDQEWRRGAREFQPLGLLLVEVDNFKQYAESNGKPAGDECLRIIAQAMSSYARRPGDLIARWDGEQFAVLLPSTDLHGACEVAEKIRLAVQEMRLARAGSEDQVVSVSIGAGAIIPLPEIAAAQLVEEAERALHLARANGCNRVEFKPGPRVVRAAATSIVFG